MTMTKNQKRAHWANVVKEWKASGESQTRYCQIHSIKPHQLTYWAQASRSTHLREHPKTQSGFVSVPIPDSAPAGLTVRLSTGMQLEGVTPANLAVVRQIIEWSS